MTDRTSSRGRIGAAEGADTRLKDALRRAAGGERVPAAATQRLSARIAAESLADITYTPVDSP
jgi:hypothetical protein